MNRLDESGYLIPRQQRTEIIEQLVKAGRFGEATKHMSDWLQSKTIPHMSVIKFFVNRLTQTGDVNALTHIGDLLDDVSMLKNVRPGGYCNNLLFEIKLM